VASVVATFQTVPTRSQIYFVADCKPVDSIAIVIPPSALVAVSIVNVPV